MHTQSIMALGRTIVSTTGNTIENWRAVKSEVKGPLHTHCSRDTKDIEHEKEKMIMMMMMMERSC